MGEAFPPSSEPGLSDKSVRKQGFLLVVWCPGHFCGFRGRSQPTSTREFISTSLPSAAATLGSVDLVLFSKSSSWLQEYFCTYTSIFIHSPPLVPYNSEVQVWNRDQIFGEVTTENANAFSVKASS